MTIELQCIPANTSCQREFSGYLWAVDDNTTIVIHRPGQAPVTFKAVNPSVPVQP